MEAKRRMWSRARGLWCWKITNGSCKICNVSWYLWSSEPLQLNIYIAPHHSEQHRVQNCASTLCSLALYTFEILFNHFIIYIQAGLSILRNSSLPSSPNPLKPVPIRQYLLDPNLISLIAPILVVKFHFENELYICAESRCPLTFGERFRNERVIHKCWGMPMQAWNVQWYGGAGFSRFVHTYLHGLSNLSNVLPFRKWIIRLKNLSL